MVFEVLAWYCSHGLLGKLLPSALVPPGGRRLADFAKADWVVSNNFTVV